MWFIICLISVKLDNRTIGKASSEMRFYFTAPQCLFSSSAKDVVSATDFEAVVNKRASYISGQTICGDAILANIGYTRRSSTSNLLYEDVSLCTYYRFFFSSHFSFPGFSLFVSEKGTCHCVYLG